MLTAQQPATEEILEVATGFMASKHLFAANEIGLFAALADGPATLELIAERTGVPTRTTRIVADAMVALGFLEREEGTYRNGAAAAAFLAVCGPTSLAPLLRFMNAISYPIWNGLERAVRTDAPARGELTEEQQQIFSEGVEAFTAGPAHALATEYDFARHRRILDIGGGTGSFLVAILAAHPQLEGTLFELPEVRKLAEPKLNASPVAGRISLATGDAFEGALPDGHDVVLVANLIHYFLPQRNVELLHRIRAAVAPGARLLLVDTWTDPTHTQPLAAALLAGEFLSHVGGDVYSTEQMHSWLAQAGWQPLEQLTLAGPHSAIVAEARREPLPAGADDHDLPTTRS